ncbi:hypothetical protein LTR35_014115 [Friedmanniomyces endolithicus]|uniref:OPT superfamily oligopeptide transporter n=1 Tax=Friedmanniomyces endolithicus TaxID=329885 RepID=A0AAN6FIG6_9PEZI|nr:hypothetical protein LTR35_014115 [Friedmanniomyces endolithicus]KAK0272464.1 hypothetical protein LTS00_016233 [Friedmanniomyces endolithicus]KAK0318081.1 hypothetical protein LTR82_010780 [Friedmanniomyces endolithicus]KAK1009914.1 hypothetical protein LTR54_005710 [Friedmanniomyces endolithicus]
MSNNGGALGIGSENLELENMTIKELEKDGYKNSSSEPSSVAEKGDVVDIYQTETNRTEPELDILSHEEQFPIDPDAEEETQQLTFRAVFVGCCLGGVIAASNIYLGLKTGWTFGASLFGSIFGFAILKPLSKALPSWAGGGYFGPKENVCVQSAATAAGSLGLIFTSGIPAAYQLGLLNTPKEDFGKLCTFTLACAYYGMFFAIPLRKLYILKQKLPFPSAVAAAYTIRSLHTGKNAEANAKKKTKALLIAFCLAITWRCVSEYAPGILWDWHWGWTLYSIGWKQAVKVENWSWILEFTPAFIGVGFIAGQNASYSFFGGAIVAWGIIGPSLVQLGLAFGKPVDPVKYPGYMNYMSMVLADPVNKPSPRYWLVWPGTMLLLAGSFAEVASNYKTIYASMVQLFEPLTHRFRKQDVKYDESQLIEEPCPPSEMVPIWMWGGGIIISIIFTCLIMGLQFKQNVGVTILAIFFAFLFSFIGAESCGRTNIIPVTSIGNASQLVIGGTTHGHGSISNQQLLNITGGLLALGASEQSADMLGDLKTTHLLRASPRVQFYAQCCGAIVSVFMSVAMYVLFSEAYPCINDLALADKCSFSIPDVGAYRAIAVAVTSTSLPVPKSSGILCICLMVWAFVQTFLKYRFVPAKYHGYIPNLVGMGIAFILNTTTYPGAMAFGATVAYFWKRNYPAAFGMYCYACAAGMIAGEGLGGIVGAILQIAKVSGNYYGTAIGCPAGAYCG